jgi:cytochrome c oxidase assembly factor CtaG
MLGGIIMWIPGSMMYILGALVLVARWLQEEERKPPLPEGVWSSGDTMAAPGFDH